MTMLDDDDRRILQFLYSHCRTADKRHGYTPNILACAVTCMSVSSAAVVRHVGYTLHVAAVWRTADGRPPAGEIITHTRKSVFHTALAVAGLAGVAVLGPVWLYRCAYEWTSRTPRGPARRNGAAAAEPDSDSG